jgi:hypothetical protein
MNDYVASGTIAAIKKCTQATANEKDMPDADMFIKRRIGMRTGIR